MQRTDIHGLYVPIVSPFFKGKPDIKSYTKLIETINPYIDGYIPCLSSGEGHVMSDKDWETIVTATVSSVKKPVLAGIKRPDLSSTVALAQKAKQIGCNGIVVPVPSSNDMDTLEFFTNLTKTVPIPVLIYNTETASIQSLETIKELEKNSQILGLKDSSDNTELFKTCCTLRASGTLSLPILQGMEHRLLVPEGCDGYLVALANVEPKLCKDLWKKQTDELNNKVLDLFWKYNLGGEWFVSLKALLFGRGVIQSAEQIEQHITP
jgi:4-hydroxy-tetrahydrodipicolinate synthase